MAIRRPIRPQDLEVVYYDVSRFDVTFTSPAHIDRCDFFRLYLGLGCLTFYP